MHRSTEPFHAHVYYDSADRDGAARLHDELAALLAAGTIADLLFIGEMRDRNVGPHPKPQFEVHFLAAALPTLRPLLAASGLTVLVHPLTQDDLADHTTLAQWLGEPLALDESVLDPPGRNQGIPRFARSDV